MQLALDFAREAGAAGEVPVGAVLVRDGLLLGSGRNRNLETHDPSAHAEIEALRNAGRVLGNHRLTGSTLYCTLEPCPMCAGALVHARVARVVYATPDPRTGAAGSVFDLLESPAHNHHIRVSQGVLAEASAELLRAVIVARRSGKSPAVPATPTPGGLTPG